MLNGVILLLGFIVVVTMILGLAAAAIIAILDVYDYIQYKKFESEYKRDKK